MSHTISSVLVVLLVQVLPFIGVNVGSDELTNAISTIITVIAGVYIWIRRVQKGDVTVAGVKNL